MDGLRAHKSASLRLAAPLGLPEEMREGVVELVSLVSENPRKGHATALMHTVCAEADMQGKVLLLTVEQTPVGLTFDQLHRFYERFGFVELQPSPCLMARKPEPPKIARAA